MVASSSTVHGITRIPSRWACRTRAAVTYGRYDGSFTVAPEGEPWTGETAAAPNVWAAATTSPPKSSMSRPPSHGDAPGCPASRFFRSVSATSRSPGATFLIRISEPQSKDSMLTRAPIPAARMSAASTCTNCSRAAVVRGASASIFVSMSNRRERAERARARAKTSDSSGIRGRGRPLAGERGERAAAAVQGPDLREVEAVHELADIRVRRVARRGGACVPARAPVHPGVVGHHGPAVTGDLRVEPRVVTPTSMARPNAARVDSTVSPPLPGVPRGRSRPGRPSGRRRVYQGVGDACGVPPPQAVTSAVSPVNAVTADKFLLAKMCPSYSLYDPQASGLLQSRASSSPTGLGDRF